MQRQFVFLVASLVLCGISSISAANWAVLVAGSNGWYNYRHQADVCHAYQVLHKHGIPDSNIIVMMYDDLAKNSENPTKGVIINHPDGDDVYHGVPHDYTGKDVTPKNFINVLLGNKEAMNGIGSGKVLESGPDDNVFIFYTDHGAVGLVAFPTGVLYATDLNATITKMHSQNKYKQMVIYIEACESGSMVENILPNNINVYATTASNAEESSYACYYDAKRQTYLGDVYSVVWMEDSDVEKLNEETLYQQYLVAQKKTNTSHVMQYGDLALGKAHKVGEFQGSATLNKPPRNLIKERYNELLRRDAVPTEDVRISIVTRRLAAAEENSIEKENLQRELVQLLNDRATITTRIQEIASKALSMNRGDYLEMVTEKRMPLTQHQCYKSVTQRVQEKCFDLPNEMVLNKLYIMANLCEIGLFDFTINQAVDQVCQERLHFDY
jgi:legumain